jgi:hypothetical protein
MSAEAEPRGELPIACTLGPVDGAQRISDWRRLGEEFGVGRVGDDGEVTVRFRDAAGVKLELERLAAAERICCPFLSWKVVRTSSELQLVISGENGALKALSIGLPSHSDLG